MFFFPCRILDPSFLRNRVCLQKLVVVVTVSLLVAVVLMTIVLALVVGGIPTKDQGERISPFTFIYYI